MNHDELIIKDRERNQDIVVKILKMPRGIFIWIGLDSSDFGTFEKYFLKCFSSLQF